MKMDRLRRELAKYLTGGKSLSAFHRRFVAATWDIHLTATPAAEQVVRQIQAAFHEYSYGDWPEEALRAKLRSFVTG